MVASVLMQGKIFPQIAVVSGISFALILSSAAVLKAYDVPAFGVSIFERDGVSLTAAELESVVASLVAVASDPAQDSDLKEKALGVALKLDPVNPAARKANDALSQDAAPAQIADLNAAKVSEDLWKAGHGLLKSKPSQDDAELAPYLMEISLIYHPAPPADIIWKFGEITEKKDLKWNLFLKLQPEENASNGKISELLSTLSKKSEPVIASVTPTVPTVITPAKMTDTTPASEVGISPVKIESGQIATVVQTAEGPIAVLVILEIRDPNTDEASLFSVFAPDGSERGTFEMKMRSKSGMPTGLSGLDEAAEKVKKRYPRWPDKKIAELSVLTPAGGPVKLREPRELNVSTAATFLLDQAFSGNEILEDFVHIEPTKMPNRMLDEAAKFEKSKAVIPSTLYPLMLERIAMNGGGDALAKIQLIEANGGREAREILQGKSDFPVIESLVAFDAIIAEKPAAMSVTEFSKAASVTTILTEFSEKYPFHMSAKLMANLGEKSASPELVMKKAISSIDGVMKPFASVYAEAISPDGGGVQQDLSRDFRDAGKKFSTLRTEIPSTASKYLKLAENVMDRMEVFLGMNNQTSSIGQQRHRELKAAIVELNAEGERLGLGPIGG